MDPVVEAFYESEYDESARLRSRAHGVLERVRTQELLERYLPSAPSDLLDVGGGPGVHAEWLAGRGHRVHLVDPVRRHVEAAAALDGVTAERGDARRLTHADGSQDAVLLLGPLYHLPDRADRLVALREARRVARPGAPVLAAGISRYAALLDLGSDGRLTSDLEPFLRELLATGRFRAGVVDFTEAYFHTPDGLAGELREAGLGDVQVLGVEGPAAPTLRALGMSRLPDLLDSAARAARLVEQDPALVPASSHLLAVGRA
ncbi:class I SAM-dependent methyltransferase [Jatrophihabitans fulvus]